MKFLFFVTVLLVYPKLNKAGFVDPEYAIAEWEGWGTRLGFWSNAVGGFGDEVQKEVTSALFSPDRLNLNMVRYTIGATTPGDRSCGDSPGAYPESFQDGLDSQFLPARDARSRKILLAAKALGVDIFEAFAFSPPFWITRSNCSKGNPDGAPLHDNFDPKYANAFANYMTEVVRYYHEQHNLSFTYLCPFYEASNGKWTGPGTSREGCNFERTTMAEVIKSTYAALEAKNLSFCGLSVAQEDNYNDEITSQNVFTDLGVNTFYRRIGPGRSDNNGLAKRAELYTIASRSGTKLGVNNFWRGATRLPDMTQGQALATFLIKDIRNMAVSTWSFSEALPNGLLVLPFADPKVENIKYPSGYYTLMQFSKYIRKGYTTIQISDESSVAAYSNSSNILVIVMHNPDTTTINKTIDLSAFASLGKVVAFRTSPNEPHVPIFPPLIQNNQLSIDLPPSSITTLLIFNAVAYQRTNLIINGDFESSNEGQNAWYLAYGERPDDGINGEYVFRGSYSGFIDNTESKLTLTQNITVRSSRIHQLSARCATNGTGVVLGILINGNQAAETVITSNLGYQLYGLAVNAQEGDMLSVYLHSEMGNHTAQIDDVVLH